MPVLMSLSFKSLRVTCSTLVGGRGAVQTQSACCTCECWVHWFTRKRRKSPSRSSTRFVAICSPLTRTTTWKLTQWLQHSVLSAYLAADYGGLHNSLPGGWQIWSCTNLETANHIWPETSRQWHQGPIDRRSSRYIAAQQTLLRSSSNAAADHYLLAFKNHPASWYKSAVLLWSAELTISCMRRFYSC